MELLIDGNRGIYIPQIFASSSLGVQIFNYSTVADEIEICKQGPEHPEYWDAWEYLLDNVVLSENQTLYQDGDLWAISDGETIPEMG